MERLNEEQRRRLDEVVEVLRELMHRYTSSGRWVLGREALRGFTAFLESRIAVSSEPIERLSSG